MAGHWTDGFVVRSTPRRISHDISISGGSKPRVVTVRASLAEVREWCAVAARAADAKQAEDVVILGVGGLLAITDAFVITSGANPRQVRTIAEEVEEQVKGAGGPAPLRIEGLDDARWVLMDFGDFVVHVLLVEARDFYELERLWADAEPWPWAPASAAPLVDQGAAVTG